MKRIKDLDLFSLNNRELEAHFSKILEILKAQISEDLYVINVFAASLDSFKAQLSDNDIRDQISLIKLDNQVDRAWRAIQAQLKADALQHVEKVIEAGRAVSAVFNKIADPTRLPYNDEQAALKNLLTDLRALSPQILENARVANLIDHLDASCGAFIEASDLCHEFNLMHELKDSRNGLIDVWNLLARSLENKSDHKELAGVDQAIDQINLLANHE